MEKAYICNMKFETVRWQLWFMAQDDAKTEERWREALRGLDAVGDSCRTAEEFYTKAIQHLEKHGFAHVAK